MRLAVLFAALVTAGCAPAPRYVNAHPTTHLDLAVLVEPDQYVTSGRVLDACSVWTDVGVRCVPTYHDDRDPVIVHPDYQRCPTRNGGHVFAVTEDRHITVFVDCFLVDTMIDQPLLRRILAHEIGHALGIDHLPHECEPGRHVCGEALMNDMPELEYLTPVDAAAFDDLRRRPDER